MPANCPDVVTPSALLDAVPAPVFMIRKSVATAGQQYILPSKPTAPKIHLSAPARAAPIALRDAVPAAVLIINMSVESYGTPYIFPSVPKTPPRHLSIPTKEAPSPMVLFDAVPRLVS